MSDKKDLNIINPNRPKELAQPRLRKKIKSPFAKYFVIFGSCVTIGSVGLTGVLYNTNGGINVDEEVWSRTQLELDPSIRMETMKETLNSDVNTPAQEPSNPNVNGVTPELSGSWYSNVPEELLTKGEPVVTLEMSDGTVSLYSALPWEPTDTTYVYNAKAAAADLKTYVDAKVGQDSGLNVTNTAYAYLLSGQQSIYAIDNVNCLGFAPLPCVVTKDYNNEFNEGAWTKTSTPDATVYGYGERKYCAILEKQDGTYLYLPLTAKDAKAHTFPGGIMQTHMKLMSGDNANTTSAGPFYVEVGDSRRGVRPLTEITWDGFVNTITTMQGETDAPSMIIDYMRINLELYGATSDDCAKLREYSCVGFVAW